MLKNLINSLKPYEREILAAAALARDLAKTECKQSKAASLKGAENSSRSANLNDAANSSGGENTAHATQTAQTQEQKRAPMIEIYGEDAAEFIAFFFGALCEHADAANIAPLSTIFSAGAPLSPAIRDRLAALSNARIVDIYGSSETGVIACNEGAGLKKFAPVSVQIRTDIDSSAAKREDKPFDHTDLKANSCGENSMAESKKRCVDGQNTDGQDANRSGEQASKFNADVSDKTAASQKNSSTPSTATKHDDKFTQERGLCDKFGAKQPACKFSQTGEFTISSPWCERFESRDFGYVRADEITLLGRGDRTVKINENRVSLDLLEAKLRSHEFIGECRIDLHPQRDRAVALIKLSERGEQAFRAGGKKGVTDELKAFLKPEFGAILRYFKIASKLPFNEQGKLSKKDFLSALQRYEVPIFERSAENEFRAKVRASDFYFDGHFARFPLVPAFMQLRFVLICAKAMGYELDGTQKIENLKFTNFIRPGDEISIKITEASGKLRFEISNDKVCASGRICL